jgi:hypothetical protein
MLSTQPRLRACPFFPQPHCPRQRRRPCRFSPLSQAAFFEDSTATFETRNMYFNRDFRDGTSAQQSKRDEWAQGFMLNLQSGYTDGTVGFGVDALGMLGVKLDSSPDRTGTGLLPTHDDGAPPTNIPSWA